MKVTRLIVLGPHRLLAMHKMRPIAINVARSVVCVSVCWSHGCAA